MTATLASKPAFVDLRYEMRGAGAWLTLHRPDDLNCLGPRLLDELEQAIAMASADPAVHAIVVTGSGRAVCAGADLKFLEALPADARGAEVVRFLERATAVMSRLESVTKPVIAAVNGLTMAGGLELVLCCDLVVAATEARLGDGHATYGLVPGAGASVRLPRKIGSTRAKYLFFTGDLVPAADLVTAGLVNRVVPAADLVAEVDALVTKVATRSPLALRRMKALADDALEQSRETALRAEQTAAALHAASHDFSEGLAAFNEKRRPVFQGR